LLAGSFSSGTFSIAKRFLCIAALVVPLVPPLVLTSLIIVATA